jgi:hypothetical protein
VVGRIDGALGEMKKDRVVRRFGGKKRDGWRTGGKKWGKKSTKKIIKREM